MARRKKGLTPAREKVAGRSLYARLPMVLIEQGPL